MTGNTEHAALLETLEARFEANMARHPDTAWPDVASRLNADTLAALARMEETGGEPDVVALDGEDGILFADCAAETPAGRRNLCYDEAALASRKANKPAGSAEGMAAAMGIELMTQEQYRALQRLGAFDAKTSSWLRTPADIRGKGGALFGDFRYGQVFVYHNGAESYYAVRGFRGVLRV